MDREVTNTLIDQVNDGELTWEQIARAALLYMSEQEVADMVDRVPMERIGREFVAVIK